MTMNFIYNVIQSVMDIVSLCGEKMIELEKERRKQQQKINVNYLLLFHIIPIVGVNHFLPILYLSKILVHIYVT